MSRMKILITGATGFVGAQVLNKFMDTEHEVTLLVRQQSIIPKQFEGRCKVLRVHSLLEPFRAETDVLIHMAGKSKWGSLETSQNLFESLDMMSNLMKCVSYKRIVFVSSAAAQMYDKFSAPDIFYYALAKKINERKVLQQKSYAVVRLGEVYGIDPGFITAGNIVTLRDSPFVTGGRVSVCSVEGAGFAIYKASLVQESGIFDVGGDNVYVSQMGQFIRKYSGHSGFVLSVPSFMVKLGAKYFSKQLNLEPEAAKYSTFDWSQDSSLSCKVLGYKKEKYTDILTRICDWLKQQHK